MNILQVLPELNVGGVETGTLDLSRHLIKLGHKAVVVSAGGELVPTLQSFGAIHYELPVHQKSIPSMIRTVSRLAEIIRKEEIDVVHARSRVPAWIAWWAARQTGVVFITTCHGYYTKHPFSYVMGWAKRVIVLSNVIGRHMIDDFGVPHGRIRLIPRSVDLERFKFTDPAGKRKKEFNVGIVGRITPIKGHLVFIKAMAKVARSVPHMKIWIVGDAPASKESYKEQVQILVRRLGLWHCTQFLGTQRDIPAVLANLDLLVMATTTQEAFGRVVIEAQAAGVPVVATKVGGVIDIIEDEKTGFLVPAQDPAAMAEAALRVFKKPEEASRLAAAAYAKVKAEYTVERMVRETVRIYEEAVQSTNLLVIKVSSIGDVILSTAALRALREKFPSPHRISVLVGQEAKELLLGCPYIDEMIVCDLKNKDKGLGGLLRLGRRLRKENFEIVVDLQNNRASHILAALSCAVRRYGYDNKKLSFLLSDRIKDAKDPVDPVTHQFRLLKMLGITLSDPHLECWPTDEDRRYVEDFLQSHWIAAQQRIVGVNVSASVRWHTKSWPLRHIVKLCEELGRWDIRVVLTGTPADAQFSRRVAGLVKGAKPIDACGKTTLNQLACLIKRCSVYVSVDSAPLHIAASMGVPSVALFGPTDPRRHLPPETHRVVISKELLCGPCYKSKCRKHGCMEQISPEEVLKAVDRLLK